MKTLLLKLNTKLDQKGVSAVFIAITLFSLIGISALAIDISHLYLASNQLQNGADAGALSGAQNLFNADGSINTNANTLGRDTAILNMADKTAVEVNLPGDVQRGHYSFTTGQFTAKDDITTMAPIAWTTFAELDTNENFINAVQCTTRREAVPAASFFAQIFGKTGFNLNNKAVAYITSTPPLVFDVPIAICRQAIENSDGSYTCGNGRMINSGTGTSGQSGGWTNFSQEPCTTANANDMKNVVDNTKMCGGAGISSPLNLFQGVGTVNGQQDSVYNPLYNCWKNDADYKTDASKTFPDKHATWTLPVIECDQDGRVTSTCSTVVGAVTVDVVWISNQNDPNFNNIPTKMDDWPIATTPAYCSNPAGTTKEQRQTCWNDFAAHFGIGSGTDRTPYYTQKTIYFLPDCTASTNNSTSFSPFKISKLVK